MPLKGSGELWGLPLRGENHTAAGQLAAQAGSRLLHAHILAPAAHQSNSRIESRANHLGSTSPVHPRALHYPVDGILRPAQSDSHQVEILRRHGCHSFPIRRIMSRSATPEVPFRKRVLYLEPEWLPHNAVDAAAETPTLFDPNVISAVDQIVQPHLKSPVDTASDAPLARRLRHLLDDRLQETFTIAEAAAQSGFHDQSHLTRHFRRTLGTPPGVFAA
ncbi:hypothetical protein GCM10009689_28790 [Brevibacterium antiquum]|uniref:helix-turn-helix domain-containing protein n=2 Tax=Brevibacterium antiquum TaxID=234835 RepID=UPI00337EF168